MLRLFVPLIAAVFTFQFGFSREFSVAVYNVENLFDVDGVALFDSYQSGPTGPYGLDQLLNKLEGIRLSLEAIDPEKGPDVILFQEFELDRTPFGTPEAAAFLDAHREQSLLELLESDSSARFLPSELLLLKYLDDHDMGGYFIAQPDYRLMETHPPHKNVVFTRFPIRYVLQREKYQARQLLEVGIDVDGALLILLNNHWKSGASNAQLEPVRVQNARVVRARLDAILLENPSADVIIGGDLNAYYNHRAVFPDLAETAVNDVLRSSGDEAAMLHPHARDLYNLWFELPPEERGSEVWRGSWGTLMQILLTPGLYDQRGIQYVDNSFQRLILPGINTDTRWNRPRSWSNLAGGVGFSDHLPIYARFRLVTEPADGPMALDNPSMEELSAFRPTVPFAQLNPESVPSAAFLQTMSLRELSEQIGEVFEITQRIAATDPLRIQIGNEHFEIFSPLPEVRTRLEKLRAGDRLSAFGDLEDWRGKLQFVIRHESWLKQ